MSTCITCAFWAPMVRFPDTDGFCHRYPPARAAHGDYNAFQQVKHDAWCGEYDAAVLPPARTNQTPGVIADPVAYAAALANGTVVELQP